VAPRSKVTGQPKSSPDGQDASLSGQQQTVRAKSDLADPSEIILRVGKLVTRMERALTQAEFAGSVKDITSVSREVRELYKLCAQFSGLLSTKVAIQITSSPVFVRFVERIGAAVLECPTCATAYEQALQEAAEAGKPT
jgi:hypothetical protein